MTTPSVRQEKEIREPSLLEALIPLVFFINPIPAMVFGFAAINVQQLNPEDQPALESLAQAPLVDMSK